MDSCSWASIGDILNYLNSLIEPNLPPYTAEEIQTPPSCTGTTKPTTSPSGCQCVNIPDTITLKMPDLVTAVNNLCQCLAQFFGPQSQPSFVDAEQPDQPFGDPDIPEDALFPPEELT